jgi:hypothetical protein
MFSLISLFLWRNQRALPKENEEYKGKRLRDDDGDVLWSAQTCLSIHLLAWLLLFD